MEHYRFQEISVVLPCFNEARTIFANLGKIHDFLATNFEKWEIIAVNDGSRDETLLELQKAQAAFGNQIIDLPYNLGKGGAVRAGIMQARYSAVLFLDADLAIPIEELTKFYLNLNENYDIVIASRFVPGLKILEPVLWYRKLMENVYRWLRMLIINNYHIRDTQCGFKLFKTAVAKKIFSKATVQRFAFDSEIIFIAGKFKYRIKELPISLQNPRESHVRIICDPLNMLKDLLKIRLNDLRGKYFD